jgi:hypothetical protein
MREGVAQTFARYAHSGRSTVTRGRGAAERSSRTAGEHPGARVRWDRLGRLAMVFVLAALLYLYLSAGIHMLSTWRQARSDSAAVVVGEREHGMLLRQHEALGRRGTLEAEARRLGMDKQGEQQYIVSGLPSN